MNSEDNKPGNSISADDDSSSDFDFSDGDADGEAGLENIFAKNKQKSLDPSTKK